MQSKDRPRLLERLALRLSASRNIDGLWLGAFLEEESERIFGRVEDALRLIKACDPLRYRRLLQDLKRVWVLNAPGAVAHYNHALRACQLSPGFVLADESTAEVIADAIVHEAAHARLDGCGLEYTATLRSRIESLCVRRQLAFAAKLPNGQMLRERAERPLAWLSDPSYAGYWSDRAMRDRNDQGMIEALRQLGAPAWLPKLLVRLRNGYFRARGRKDPD